MRILYLVCAFISFLIYIILQRIENELMWLALGFGVMMLLFGLFCKRKKMDEIVAVLDIIKSSKDDNATPSNDGSDDLNNKGGKKNDI